MRLLPLPGALSMALAALAASAPAQQSEPPASAPSPRVEIRRLDDRLRVEIDGKLFTVYRYRGLSRPVLFPVIGPGGQRMTRKWPLETDDPAEAHDHSHQKSLWFAHGAVNGHDFWSEARGAGRIVHDRFLEVRSGEVGLIRSRNLWQTAGGKTVCTDLRTLRIRVETGARVLDYEVELRASHGDVLLGDTKEGTMAIRLNPRLRLVGKVAEGECVTSEGVRGRRAWGTRASWIDYHGPIDGKVVGVAIFDHPQNLRHPTWWHARDYGLFAANPFGAHDFQRLPRGTGDYTIRKGESLTLRYRFVFHEGDEKQARIAARYAAWTR